MPLDPSLDPLFQTAAQQYNLDPTLLKAVALTESSGNPNAVSPAGAKGLMQFIDPTAAQYGVKNPFDPSQAIPGAAHYLSNLLGTYEAQVGAGPTAVAMALKGYNAGDPSRWNNPETIAYPGAVAHWYATLSQPQPAAAKGGSVDPNVAALAAAGTPQASPPAPGQQVAQAAQSDGMSDEDLLNGFVNGTLPFMKANGAAAVPAGGPNAVPAPEGAPPNQLAPAQPQSAPQPALDVPGLIQTYNTYRSFPAGIGLAQGALGMLQKMAPEGYRLNQDGTLSLAPGYAQGANTLKANEAAGSQLATVGPNGQVAPMPGAAQTIQTMANAKAEGEGQAQRETQAVAPQTFRGAGSGTFYPPGSPAAQGLLNAAQNGQAQQGTEIKPVGNGGVTIENTNPSSETIGKNFETLDKMSETADHARQSLYTAGLLKDRLNAIGTSGPLTQQLGDLAALAKQAGVPDDQLQKLNIPAGASVQEANAISLELLGSILHATFPSRITNSDITTFKPSNPNTNMLNEASNYLIDNIVVPKAQRDIQRYGAATDLPQNDTQTFRQQLFKWDQAHPYQMYAAPGANQLGNAAPVPGTATSTGAARPLDDATRAAAQGAISKGAPRDAVVQRLQQNGFDTKGF